MKLTVQHVDNLRFLATESEQTTVIDAAPEDGGGGTAMNAPSLFVTGIAACMLEFVINSCRLHDIPVESLSLHMTYDEVRSPRRIEGLEATLHLEPEPDGDVKRRLVGVAKHATLVNTLRRPPELHIRFAEA